MAVPALAPGHRRQHCDFYLEPNVGTPRPQGFHCQAIQNDSGAVVFRSGNQVTTDYVQPRCGLSPPDFPIPPYPAPIQAGLRAGLGNSVHYRKIKNFRRCAAPASHGCDHPVLGPGLPKVSVGGRGTRRGAGERNQPWRHSPRSQDTSWPGRDLQTSGRRSELSSVAPRPGLDGGSPRGAQRRGREAAAELTPTRA